MFSNRDELGFDSSYHTTSLQKHAIKTFSWMMLGVAVTAVSAFFFAASGLIIRMYMTSPLTPWLLLLAQFGVVIAFSARLMKMSAAAAKGLFLVYAALLGVTLSTYAFLYNAGSIVIAFAITVVYFGSLIVIGMTTKMNLLRFGPIFFGGLITLIISQVIMLFMGMDTNTMLLSALGLLLFTGLTAYDAQKMKVLYHTYEGDEQMLGKLSIYSALELYLDFINIFLYILRLLGNRD